MISTSETYREILVNNPTEQQIEDIKTDIIKNYQDVISYCKVDIDEVEDLIDLVEMVEVAYIWLDATVGEGYKYNDIGLKTARFLIKRLANSMFFNRSFEISSSAKMDIITKNTCAKLSTLEVQE